MLIPLRLKSPLSLESELKGIVVSTSLFNCFFLVDRWSLLVRYSNVLLTRIEVIQHVVKLSY